jgi:hypothetical protein
MFSRSHGAVAALALAVTSAVLAPTVFAQAQPPAQPDQDHKSHHPGGQAPDTKAPVPQPKMGGPSGQMGGMMCGDMKQMMSMMQDMHAMMGARTGTMAARLDADIGKLRADLKITEGQAPQWDRFADTLRGLARSMDETHQHMTTVEANLPARLARAEKTMQANLNAVKALEAALQPLYGVLSDQQKKIADKIKLGPMGMI